MSKYLALGKFSFGMGDRFAQQGKAQLRACVLATELGADVVPVWNKSNREHMFIGTEPSSLRAEADAAVKALGWKKILPCGRRPHPARNGGPFHRPVGFLHD